MGLGALFGGLTPQKKHGDGTASLPLLRRPWICMLCQQTSPKRWSGNVNMASYSDATNNVYPVTMITIRHCSILGFGRGHPSKQSPRASPDLCMPLLLGVTLRDKKHRPEIRKARDVKPLLPIERTSYVSSAMCPECPRKEWWHMSFGLQSTPKAKRPRDRPRNRWRDCVSDLAWSLWYGASRTICDCCWSWGISGPPRAAASAILPKRNVGTKMSDWRSV